MPNGGRFALKQFALWTISGCLSFGVFFCHFGYFYIGILKFSLKFSVLFLSKTADYQE